jgi:hypothetical protein
MEINKKGQIMQNSTISPIHNNHANQGSNASVPPVSSTSYNVANSPSGGLRTQHPHGSAAPSHTVWLRSLITQEMRDRKFRADSLMAKLTSEQRATLIGWLQQHEVLKVQSMVAAPPPMGFGIDAQLNTLYRLKNLIKNTELTHWITNGMDAAYDVLSGEGAQEVEPMRETIRLLLYNRVLTYVRDQTDPSSVDRLLSCINRLDKIERIVEARQRSPRPPRLKVDVSISPAPATNSVNVTIPNVPEIDEPDLSSLGEAQPQPRKEIQNG